MRIEETPDGSNGWQNEWLYIHTHTAELARKFFGLPPDTSMERLTGKVGEWGRWKLRVPLRLRATEFKIQP